MRYWILLICLALAAAQNITVPFLPEIREVDGYTQVNIDLEGGHEQDGIIFNATLVHGRFPEMNTKRNKRITNVATFCKNSNLGGSCFTMTDAQLAIYDLGTIGFANSITSLQVLDLTCTVHVWTQINGQGTCWNFRSPVQVGNMADYGLNDNIESIIINCDRGYTPRGLILYENSGYSGKSAYVTGTFVPNSNNYPTMASTSTCGVVGNDKVSSLILLSYTKVVLYPDINYGGTPVFYGVGDAQYYYYTAVPNDQASSVSVAYTQ